MAFHFHVMSLWRQSLRPRRCDDCCTDVSEARDPRLISTRPPYRSMGWLDLNGLVQEENPQTHINIYYRGFRYQLWEPLSIGKFYLFGAIVLKTPDFLSCGNSLLDFLYRVLTFCCKSVRELNGFRKKLFSPREAFLLTLQKMKQVQLNLKISQSMFLILSDTQAFRGRRSMQLLNMCRESRAVWGEALPNMRLVYGGTERSFCQ